MNREEAVMCIQLGCLLPELRKRKLVTEFEVHQLSDKIKAPKEKNRHLMSIIESKGEKGFDLFIQALEAEKQHVNHSHLAKMLREAQAALTGQLITPPRLPPKVFKVTILVCIHTYIHNYSNTYFIRDWICQKGLILEIINIKKSRFEILNTVYLKNAWCFVYAILH